MPTTDIFIRTYSRDAAYHAFCIASIGKFCTGFRDTVVVTQEDPTPAIGYLTQQICKMSADQHSDADFFLVTDSDTLFTKPVTPGTFMRDGKPIWIHTPWTEEMLRHPGTRTWFNVMRAFHGVEAPSEFMRRQGFMVPRWLLQSLREFCEKNHGQTIHDYVMSRGVFSEWNVLGHHAWLHHRDEFHWIDSSKDELPELVLRQFWSHDSIMKNIREIERIFGQ